MERHCRHTAIVLWAVTSTAPATHLILFRSFFSRWSRNSVEPFRDRTAMSDVGSCTCANVTGTRIYKRQQGCAGMRLRAVIGCADRVHSPGYRQSNNHDREHVTRHTPVAPAAGCHRTVDTICICVVNAIRPSRNGGRMLCTMSVTRFSVSSSNSVSTPPRTTTPLHATRHTKCTGNVN